MPGIGINTIRRGMAIKNRGLSVLQKVGNGIVQRRKTWLPYVGILVCLGAVWFWWEEPQGQVNMKRDASQQQAEKHPVFDTPEKEAEGSLVYDIRPAIQYKPLPDLFGGSLPKKAVAAEPKGGPDMSPTAKSVKTTESVQPQWTLPTVGGSIHQGKDHLVLLQWQGQSAACAAGESWQGWYIAYINRQAVGLMRDGKLWEIRL